MTTYKIVVGLHVITAFAFVYTTVYMQLLMARVMKRFPEGPEKQEAVALIQQKVHPIVDSVILVLGGTALYLVSQNGHRILHDPVFTVKVLFGLLSLGSAISIHFYFRYVKRSLIAGGAGPERLLPLNKKIRILEMIAMKAGIIALLLGVYANHVR